MAENVHRITALGGEAPHAAPPERDPAVIRGIDRVLAIQRPVVLAHLRSIRRRAPGASPQQLVRILERRYLAAITTGGAAVGATAVVPGIGTGITLALSGVETAGFLEATALFAQSVAEVHGIAVENPERARALVMTLMLGQEGSDLVRQFAGQAIGQAPARTAYWGELITNTLPKAVMSTVADRLKSAFVKQFAVRGGASFIGKAIPFGIGAAIGGAGNHILGRRVLAQSRLAFGAPPAVLPAELEPRERAAGERRVPLAALRLGSAVTGAAGATARSAGALWTRAGSAARASGRALTRRPAPEDADQIESTERSPESTSDIG